ncbi:MAG: hypothetical protein VCD00_08190 [Candidatus Hydrogenedentota bacterium]
MRNLLRSWLIGLTLIGSAQALDVSHEDPLFVFPAPVPVVDTAEAYVGSITDAWTALPEFFQGHAAISIPHRSVPLDDRVARLIATLDGLKTSAVPVVPTIAFGPTKEFLMFEAVNGLLATYPNIKAIHVERIQFDADLDAGDLSILSVDPLQLWLEGIINIVSKSNVKLIVELDGLNPLILMSHPRYRALYQTMTKHTDKIIFTYRQGDYHTLSGNSALMGLWLEGAIGNWGVALDSAAYTQAGFVAPGRLGFNVLSGAMPPALYRAWILNGAMTGASTYWFHEPNELWAGMQSRYWAQVIAPTLVELVRRGYIARKDLVARKAAVAYRLNASTTWSEFEANLADLDPVFHDGTLMQAAYNVSPDNPNPEWTPNSGTHYWIPILSPNAPEDTLFSFKEVFTPGAVLDVASWRERLADHYPAAVGNGAFVQKVGRAQFVVHTQENLYEAQAYTLPNAPAPLHDITATREGSKVTIAWPFREGDLSYSVYRIEEPELDTLRPDDFIEIAGGIDTRNYIDENIAPGSSVAYSVTAVTNEQAPQSGVVNFGDYLMTSGVESRVDGFAFVEPYTMRGRTVNGFGVSDISELPERQSWSRIPDDIEEHVVVAYGATETTLHELANALQEGRVDEAMSLFTEDFSDAEGSNRQGLGNLLRAFMNSHSIAAVPHQVYEWENNDFEFSGELIATAYFRMVTRPKDPALVAIPIQSLPPLETALLRFTFYEDFNGDWKIKRIEPPLIRLTDLLNLSKSETHVQE